MTTTTLKTSALPREFVFNGSRIPDPDPKMGVEEDLVALLSRWRRLRIRKPTS